MLDTTAIRKAMGASGLTQAQLAARARITLPYLNRLLMAKQCNPSLDVACRLAAALGVGVGELVVLNDTARRR